MTGRTNYLDVLCRPRMAWSMKLDIFQMCYVATRVLQRADDNVFRPKRLRTAGVVTKGPSGGVRAPATSAKVDFNTSVTMDTT